MGVLSYFLFQTSNIFRCIQCNKTLLPFKISRSGWCCIHYLRVSENNIIQSRFYRYNNVFSKLSATLVENEEVLSIICCLLLPWLSPVFHYTDSIEFFSLHIIAQNVFHNLLENSPATPQSTSDLGAH